MDNLLGWFSTKATDLEVAVNDDDQHDQGDHDGQSQGESLPFVNIMFFLARLARPRGIVLPLLVKTWITN